MQPVIFFGLLFGSITLIVLGVTALETWGKLQKPRSEGNAAELRQRLDQVEEELETLRDQVTELLLESHDAGLLPSEEERLDSVRSRSR